MSLFSKPKIAARARTLVFRDNELLNDFEDVDSEKVLAQYKPSAGMVLLHFYRFSAEAWRPNGVHLPLLNFEDAWTWAYREKCYMSEPVIAWLVLLEINYSDKSLFGVSSANGRMSSRNALFGARYGTNQSLKP